MANLTAAQYKAEMDKALAQYEAFSVVQLDRGAAWSQVASGYCHLWLHQQMFDNKGVVPNAAALVYRTKAETLLTRAKTRAASLPLSTPASVAASQAASVAAYSYVQLVKIQEALAE